MDFANKEDGELKDIESTYKMLNTKSTTITEIEKKLDLTLSMMD